MNTLSQQFNKQTNWNISMLSLYMLIIIDDIERREMCRKERISKMQSEFWVASMKETRDDYYRHGNCLPRQLPATRP